MQPKKNEDSSVMEGELEGYIQDLTDQKGRGRQKVERLGVLG